MSDFHGFPIPVKVIVLFIFCKSFDNEIFSQISTKKAFQIITVMHNFLNICFQDIIDANIIHTK